MTNAIAIDARDNVATALRTLVPGDTVAIGARTLTVRDAIPAGHKVAIADVAAGAVVLKYGSPIGLALTDITVGAHVHTHNLASTRGRGDLGGAVRSRLAEPQGDAAEPSSAEGSGA